MKLITEVEIKNFRSIKECKISNIKDFNSLYGLNNSGKSNILRALNLFFNNKTDEGTDFDFDTDFHISSKKTKKRQEIRISVTFVLPENFKFQKRMTYIRNFILKDSKNGQIKIRKIFRRENHDNKINLNDKPVKDNDFKHIGRFLALINFRYIPNRVLPVEIMKKETNNIRKAVIRKFNIQRKDKKKIKRAANNLSESIKKSANELIKPVSDAFKQVYKGNHSVELVTPSLIEDLISTSGYFISTDNIRIKDTYQGSGIQSFLMFHTLNLIDKDYAQKFGWKQATIWAVEEPESSLHSDLEAHLAHFLFKMVTEKISRLQIFCTTHSTMFADHSQKSVFLKKIDNTTHCEDVAPENVHRKATQLGISHYTHPLLFFPRKSIVLCEGKTDVNFFKRIVTVLDLDQLNTHITCLSDLEGDRDSGGKDTIQRYIKNNKNLIKDRFSIYNTRIIILLDWDVDNQKWNMINNINGVSIVQWPKNLVNDRSKNLKGIESLYPLRFLKDAFNMELFSRILSKNKNGDYSYSKKDTESINKLKNFLSKKVMSNLTKEDVDQFKDFIKNKILI